MTQINPQAALLDGTGGLNTSPARQGPQAAPEDPAKAEAILRSLLAAGLKEPYQFNLQEAVALWAPVLNRYTFEDLQEAAKAWTQGPDKEFPSLGQLETQVKYVASHKTTTLDNDDQAINT